MYKIVCCKSSEDSLEYMPAYGFQLLLRTLIYENSNILGWITSIIMIIQPKQVIMMV